MTFYEALELIMREKHVKAADLCAKTGISSSYFTKLKKGDMKDVTWEKALQIILALEITPNDFEKVQRTGHVQYAMVRLDNED